MSPTCDRDPAYGGVDGSAESRRRDPLGNSGSGDASCGQ